MFHIVTDRARVPRKVIFCGGAPTPATGQKTPRREAVAWITLDVAIEDTP